MNKDSNYYRKRLNIETIILLSITFFFFILRFITLTSYPKDIQMVYLLCLFVYLMLLIILLCNYKEKKKFIGTLSIVVGLLMTILIFINRSLTSILYLIFSVIYIFSSIKYLQALKKENIKDDTKETKISIILVILGLFLNILCIILIYDLPSSLVIIKLILCGLFAIGAPALILISIKHRKGTIKYLILSVSILFSIMCLAILPRNIKYDIARNKIEEENNKTYLHSGCFDYTIDGVITKYTCEDKHIIIPSEIEETIITKVNAKFMNSFESIEIPSTIDEMNFDNIIYYSSIEKMRIINHSQKLKFDLSNFEKRNYLNLTIYTVENDSLNNINTGITIKPITNKIEKNIPIKFDSNIIYSKAIENITLEKSSVRVSGYKEILDEIDYINAKANKNIIEESGNYELTLDDTFGIDNYEFNKVNANIELGDSIKKEFILPLEIKNLNDYYNARILDENITVVVRGTENNLKNLDDSKIKAYLDLSGYISGSYNVIVKTECENQNLTITSKKPYINVILRKNEIR